MVAEIADVGARTHAQTDTDMYAHSHTHGHLHTHESDERSHLAEGFSTPGRGNRDTFSSTVGSGSGSGTGVRFGELLRLVAAVDPEIRIRFQSPHPKVSIITSKFN